ncbi:hypothetical protein PVAG01_11058 [Phlyctema vagabunda]|uniref:non-specific serine/threonine protein kinase n=1 Tax=Phlyctema vagabunda TaxID=108571 RepID=A0ABR4P411_9HELO
MPINSRYDLQEHIDEIGPHGTTQYLTSVVRRSDNEHFLAVPFRLLYELEDDPKEAPRRKGPPSTPRTTEFDANGNPVLWQDDNTPKLDENGNRIFLDTTGCEVINGITTRNGEPCPPYGEGFIRLPAGYDEEGEREVRISEFLAQRRATWRKRSMLNILLPIAATSVSRILNHPNIVSLADIVDEMDTAWAGNHSGSFASCIIWEDMNAGDLTKLLPSTIPPYADVQAWFSLVQPDPQRFSLPESLCWHVLTSISRALLWLHYGAKETPEVQGGWAFQDEDWQTIFHRDINPGNIFFKKPTGDETYGECKLGGFTFCKLAPDIFQPEVEVPRDVQAYNRYFWSPEIFRREQTFGIPSEIYALGAVLYNMMTGMPPPRSRADNHQFNMSRMNDRGFSTGLRRIVEVMLHQDYWQRPSTLQLYNLANDGYRKWRATTLDGGQYVDVKDKNLARIYIGENRHHRGRALKGTRWEDWKVHTGAT